MEETLFIAPGAEIGSGCEFGKFVHIADGVKIGRNCRIGDHVTLSAGTILENGVVVASHTIIGRTKLRSAWSVFQVDEQDTPARLGDECMVGSQVVIYRGAQLGKNVMVADGASIREEVIIGDFTIVGRAVTIEQRTTIGKRCKLETACYITALSVVEDYCFIAPMVVTSNDNFLGRTEERKKRFKGIVVRRGGRLGAGSVILPGLEIGEDAVVAAGAVVTKNVPPGKVVMGVPARIVRNVAPEQLLENQGWEQV